MGYNIKYGHTDEVVVTRQRNSKPNFQGIVMVICVISMLLILTFCFQSGSLSEYILPGNSDVTKKALAAFAEDLKAGQPVKEAFVEFCRDIIDHAEIPD